MFFLGIPFEPPRAVMTPRTFMKRLWDRLGDRGRRAEVRRKGLLRSDDFVHEMQAFLNIGVKGCESLGDALSDITIAVKSAWGIVTMSQLGADGFEYILMEWLHVDHVLVRFSAFQAIANPIDGSAGIA